MIILKGVSKAFGQHQGLKPTTLTIEDGKTTVLIGPSGCGKSTLLRLITGLVKPTQGQLYFDQEEVTEHSINLLRRKIGYVIQDGGLFPHLTARNNLSLLANYLRYASQFIQERIDYLCDLVHLPKKLLDSYPNHLSGGERGRISLMRALMLDPTYIFLDEPFAALDPITRYELQQHLKEIFSRLRKTTLLVTHDMREAAYLGDQMILMRDGQVVQKGTFQELKNTPAEPFVSHFIEAQVYL